MGDNVQELHKNTVCNNPVLHTHKKCNCYATDSATGMQQDSIKARALAVLQRNTQRNSNATESEKLCNKTCNKAPKVAQKVASKKDIIMQQRSSDWVRFCLAHQNTWPEGQCPVKRDQIDPMSQCLGWRMKTKQLH